jgi:hypothetical protein
MSLFLFATASRPALGPTPPPIQWVPGGTSPGIKQPGLKADHPPSFNAEVKNAWSYTSTSTCLHVVVLGKAQGQLYHPRNI